MTTLATACLLACLLAHPHRYLQTASAKGFSSESLHKMKCAAPPQAQAFLELDVLIDLLG